MREAMGAALVAFVAVLTITAPAALAGNRDVVKTGSCSDRSGWKLKLSPEHSRIEVDFEVDTPRTGQTWRVGLRHNGDLIFR